MFEQKLIVFTLLMFIAVCFSACSFHIGVDYTGKTDKSNTTESPDFRMRKLNKDN